MQDHDETYPDLTKDNAKQGLDHAMRDPLVSLAVLTPYFLWAEGLRFLDLDKTELLAEQNFHLLGEAVGISGILIPWLLLVIACPLIQWISKRPWSWPRSSVMMWVLIWELSGALSERSLLIPVLPSYRLRSIAHSLETTTTMTRTAVLMAGSFQEELIFRGLILGSFCLILPVLGLRHAAWQFALALPLSAAIFALATHRCYQPSCRCRAVTVAVGDYPWHSWTHLRLRVFCA